MSEDKINHPAHYTYGPIEVIDIIEGFNLGYHLGNVVKYILRAPRKGGVEDLKKARWYLDREITRAEQRLAEQNLSAAAAFREVIAPQLRPKP